MKIVVFDLWGDFAHFRVPYTTSSPLTFPVPSKTVLYGIISAFLGYDKNNYLENFQKKQWSFAIGVRDKISTIRIPENFINTKTVKMFARMPKGKSCRTQINMEFLKNPFYRIYVSSTNEQELARFQKLLKEHKSVYTISLGISECLANFKYIGSFDAEKESFKSDVDISTIIPIKQQGKSFKINFLQADSHFLKVHLPLEMHKDRELIESGDFLLEITGKKITASLENFIFLKELNENIVLF